jgi:V-type H+-transporting ATPase subunit H
MFDKECMDHLAMINAYSTVQKLKDRVWVDENIEKIIDQLLFKFDQDY